MGGYTNTEKERVVLSKAGYETSAGDDNYGSTKTDDDQNYDDPTAPPCGCLKFLPAWYRREALSVVKLSWPMVLTSMFNFLMAPISLIFCGRLSREELGGVALAHTVINAFGIIVGTGLCTAIDTLVSQSFGGTNKKMIGIYLQRGLIITGLFCLPIMVLHMNISPFLIAIGQEPEVAIIAGNFVLLFMPGLFFNFMYQVLTKYLYNQNVVFPCIVFGVLGCVVNALSHVGLVMYGDLRTTGSAISMVITFFSMMSFSLIYIVSTGFYKPTWTGWSTEALQDWGPFCSLAVPGLFMLVLEWGSFEIGTFLTGLLGVVPLDAQTIVFQVEGISFQIPLGLSIAANIRVGQFLGNGDGLSAKRTSFTCLTIGGLAAVVMSTILASCREYIPMIFTDDRDVVNYAANILPILATYMVFNCIQGVGAGILRGCGRQLIGAVFVFIAYFILALPIGIPVMFLTYLEAQGFWWGLTIGLFIEAILFLLLIYRTNWDYQVSRAQERNGMDSKNAGIVEEGTGDTDVILLSESEYRNTTDSDTEIVTGGFSGKKRRRKPRLASIEQGNASPRLATIEQGNASPRLASTDQGYASPRLATTEQGYASPYASQQDLNEIISNSRRLTTKELVFRRGLTLLALLMFLGLGVYLRVLLEVYLPLDDLEPRANTTTFPANYTVPTTAALPNASLSY